MISTLHTLSILPIPVLGSYPHFNEALKVERFCPSKQQFCPSKQRVKDLNIATPPPSPHCSLLIRDVELAPPDFTGGNYAVFLQFSLPPPKLKCPFEITNSEKDFLRSGVGLKPNTSKPIKLSDSS